jgi:SPX domain protein involved in polyphosphate accumulation
VNIVSIKKTNSNQQETPTQTANSSYNSRFERSAVKYWLPEELLLQLKLELSRKLPLDPHLNVYKDRVFVFSVYFDDYGNLSDGSSAGKFNFYQRRVKKEEGAQLIRLRTYGLAPSELFVEVKTHHESWVRDSSVKERSDLRF